MRHKRRAGVLAASALLVSPVVLLSPLVAQAALPTAALPAALPAAPSGTSWPAVPVAERLQPWLADQLATATTDAVRVMVSGQTTAAATAAATTAGLRVQQTWASSGIVVAVGLPAQVLSVVGQPGVTYVEGEQPIEFALSTAHDATRSTEALATLTTEDGARIDGSGVSVAVVDSGIDGTHPFFRDADGSSTVVANLKNVCTAASAPTDVCFVEDPSGDTDTSAAGGHGTHVAGIVAGVETTTTGASPQELRGSAPAAKLVGLSVGGGLSIINANAAMQWVAEHHAQPCRSASEQDGPADAACPPIRVTNHSYGPAASSGGNTFDENSATVRIQRVLVNAGIVPVWAAGNDGGDGSSAFTNPPAMDPTPGVIMVASYNDGGTGDRDNELSSFSSRGNLEDTSTYPDVSAPGDQITSACRPYLAICSTGMAPVNGPGAADIGTFNTISGTSMAAPYIAGVVAQLFSLDPTLTPAQVEALLEGGAHKFGTGYVADDPARNADSLTSFDKGHGLVDVFATLTALQNALAPDASPSAEASPSVEASPTADASPSVEASPQG